MFKTRSVPVMTSSRDARQVPIEGGGYVSTIANVGYNKGGYKMDIPACD